MNDNDVDATKLDSASEKKLEITEGARKKLNDSYLCW